MQSGTFPCAHECHRWLLSGDMGSQDWDLLDQVVGGQRKSQRDLCAGRGPPHHIPSWEAFWGQDVPSQALGWRTAAPPSLWSLPVHFPNLVIPRFHHRTLVSEWRGFSSAHLPVYRLGAASMNFTFVLLGM